MQLGPIDSAICELRNGMRNGYDKKYYRIGRCNRLHPY